MTFLAIDVGNTRLKWALYAAPHPGAALLHHGASFLETIDELAERQWSGLPEPASMLGCIVAGDAVRRRVEQQMELWDIDPHWVVPSAHEAGLVNGYDHPSRLGSDRWVALAGARSRVLASHQVRPALVVALILSFVTMMSVLSVPLMINPNSPTMITVDIAYRINTHSDYGVANALCLASLVLAAGGAWFYLRHAVAKAETAGQP